MVGHPEGWLQAFIEVIGGYLKCFAIAKRASAGPQPNLLRNRLSRAVSEAAIERRQPLTSVIAAPLRDSRVLQIANTESNYCPRKQCETSLRHRREGS